MKIAAQLYLLCLLSLSLFAENPRFGRYAGILHHNATNRDQLAKLDFIVDRFEGSTFFLSAVLSLQFGDFTSKEYVSYSFNNVLFDLVTRRLVFDESDKDLSIESIKFTDDEFVGEVAYRSQKVGTITLKTKEGVAPTSPLIEPVWGTYQSRNGVIQLQTFRSTIELSDGGNPFRSVGIRGRHATHNPSLGGIIVDSVFTSASYDFFTDRLILWGDPHAMDCKVLPGQLECGGKVYKKSPSAPPPAPLLFPPERKLDSSFSGTEDPEGSFSGKYKGYIFHEFLNEAQKLDLDVVATSVGGALRLSVTGRLYFGPQGTSEVISYKFDPRNYPLTAPQFVLRRGGTDAIVQITSLRAGTIKGIWYSSIFGRVGPFEVSKSGVDTVQPSPMFTTNISRKSKPEDWEMELFVAQGVSPVGTANPFFPLTFGGYFWDTRTGLFQKSPIRGGSYDFYTGRIALSMNVDGEDVYMVGERLSNGKLDMLFYLSNKFGVRLVPLRMVF